MVNKKRKCDCCEKTYNAKKLTKNKVTGQILCYNCNRRIGSNKFYSPIIHKSNNRINIYSITDQEKIVLIKKGSNINKLCTGLKIMKEKKKQDMKKELLQKRLQESEKQEKNKKFLEGLK